MKMWASEVIRNDKKKSEVLKQLQLIRKFQKTIQRREEENMSRAVLDLEEANMGTVSLEISQQKIEKLVVNKHRNNPGQKEVKKSKKTCNTE